MKIFLLSDTHGYINDDILRHASEADEVWHAGDFGENRVLERLAEVTILRGVFGNIDSQEVRGQMPEHLEFTAGGAKVCMTHIGGYPPRYAKGVKDWLIKARPAIFICGHSHILKAMPDPQLHLFHLNPGAAGKQGWHKVRTAMRLEVENARLSKLEIIEFGSR